jgi:ribosomal protein L3 glutamine methyltransferase
LSNLITLATVRDWLRYAVSRFNAAHLNFGHGTDNAYDEAVWLILSSLHLPVDQLAPFLDAHLLDDERALLAERIRRRCEERIPTAYLVGEAWLHGLRFEVTPAVIVPRSFLAGMILERLAPWLDETQPVTHALDLCTGSGCLAILLAHVFPEAKIDAIDLSPEALAVARRNVDQHGVTERVRLIESNLFAAVPEHRWDLIVSNPPYVDAKAMATLPSEYQHEPNMALASGIDGLDATRTILAEAKQHLNPGGLLVVEIGHNRAALEAAFPTLDFVWPELEGGDDMVFVLTREQLP